MNTNNLSIYLTQIPLNCYEAEFYKQLKKSLTMNDDYMLSRNIKGSSLPKEYDQWTLENKIDIFIDRVRFWQLDIADRIINGYENQNRAKIPDIPHSGYATLSILTNYFEMYGKYYSGYIEKESNSRYFFEKGFNLIANELGWYKEFSYTKEQLETIQEVVEKRTGMKIMLEIKGIKESPLIKELYKNVRCGLYHIGMTLGNIRTSHIFLSSFVLMLSGDKDDCVLYINPHILPKDLIRHLEYYETQLREPKNNELRDNFEKRFNLDNKPK